MNKHLRTYTHKPGDWEPRAGVDDLVARKGINIYQVRYRDRVIETDDETLVLEDYPYFHFLPNQNFLGRDLDRRVSLIPEDEYEYIDVPHEVKFSARKEDSELILEIENITIRDHSTTVFADVDIRSDADSAIFAAADQEGLGLGVNIKVYPEDGRKVGYDHETNEFINEIDDALASGPMLGGGQEWISIPSDIETTYEIDYSFALQYMEENGVNILDIEATVQRIDFDDQGDRTKVEEETVKIELYNIMTTAYPEEGGQVSGGRAFEPGEQTTVKAEPAEGYEFINWTEDNEEVSDNKEYTFTVTEDRELVANFEKDDYRLVGGNRYQTAIEVSQAGWESAGTVIIARCDEYPDSLSGVSLAYAMDAPILLTETEKLNEETGKEIERLNAERAIILGGTAAVVEEVEDELEQTVDTVERIGGKNRYETAQLIAERFVEKVGDVEEAFIAYGNNFPDALSAASYAAVKEMPILLTDTESIHDSTKQALEDMQIKSTIVVGGKAVIGESVFNELPDPARIAGADRWETSLELADNYLPEDTKHIYIATGRNFPDALAGGVITAKNNSGVLLVPGEKLELPDDIGQFISDWGITDTTIFGGTSAVSAGIHQQLIDLRQ